MSGGSRHEVDDLLALASRALDNRQEAQAEPVLAAYAREHPRDARVLHFLGLLRRELDRREEALEALQTAHRIAPSDARLAHALAHVSLEAGVPAVRLFEQAIALAPSDPDLRLGLASARLAEGDGDRALDELGTLLSGNAGWVDGHRQFAQLAMLVGRAHSALASIDRALTVHPRAEVLHVLAIDLLSDAERYAEGLVAVDRALARCAATPALLLRRAALLDDLGDHSSAAAVFDRLGQGTEPDHAIWRVRHLLRTGQVGQACAEIEPWLDKAGAEAFWPYASLAWRLAGDARAEWLEGQPGLITVHDLPCDAAAMHSLKRELEMLHARAGRFMNQSVRKGTQTDGPLFARIDSGISALREKVRAAVADHVRGLGASDPRHPVLAQSRKDDPRFAGSWSVRLRDAGFHESHHHPQGWISGVFYVSLPEALPEDDGSLVLGEAPASLKLGLGPIKVIKPVPGRLVLFPSQMWHSTRPFLTGDRLTVAFDIKR